MRLLIVFLGLLPLLAQEPAKPAEEPKTEAQETTEAKPADAAPSEETATPAGDRTTTGYIDFGFRWVPDIAGNLDAYRTVVNLGQGPKLFNFDYAVQNPGGRFYDRFSFIGNNWGGEPNSSTRLDLSKLRSYDLRLDHRSIAYFNFLPTFANPRLEQGILQTQKGYDIRRNMIDAELRFRPGTRFIPYLAYSRNWGDGRGVVNYVGSGNEFPVFNGLYDKTDQYRGGVNIEFNRWHITLEQGGTTFKDDQNVSTDDRNPGNRTAPFLGQQLFLTGVRQAYRVRGDSIFQRGLLTASPFSWLDVSGQFMYSRPRTDTQYSELAVGNFANLATAQFFNTQREFIAANASMPRTSGVLNLDIRPMRRIRILESLITNRFHTASAAARSDLTIASPTPVNVSDRLAVNYNRQQVQVNVDLLRWLTVRAGHRFVWGDAETRAPVIFTTPRQSAELRQNVALFGTQLRFGQRFWVNGDAELAKADRVYFRTSLADYRKGAVRARYQLLTSLMLNANFVALTNENPNPAIRFDMKSYMSSAGFLWNPAGGRRFSVLGDYTRSTIDTNLFFLQPQTLTPALSNYRENAHTGTVLFDINSPVSGRHAPKFALGGSFFRSAGSRPTTYYTPMARFSVPVHQKGQLFAEWRNYGLSQTLYSFESFRAHTFVVGLRLLQ
jgi:hypothetical protein